MRIARLALALCASVAVAACGGPSDPGALPDESTFAITAPDETTEGESPLCVGGDERYRNGLRAELEELNLATRPYRDLYRLARLGNAVERRTNRIARRRAAAQGEASVEVTGSFDRTWTGPRGSITISVDVAEDGSKEIQVTAMKKGDDAEARVILEGHVAADELSGDWTVFGKDGTAWRTITWSKTEAGDLTSHWKNERNGKTADYTRVGDEAKLVITKVNGEKIEMSWNVETKVGSILHVSSSGNERAVCWDAAFCNVDCAL